MGIPRGRHFDERPRLEGRGFAEGAPSIKSEDLFRPDEKEVWILHEESNYRLQVTKNGKLILTK